MQLNFSVTGINGSGTNDNNITSNPWASEPNTSQSNWWYISESSNVKDAGIVVNDPNASTGGWSQLTYNGNAPDIGAYEWGGSFPGIGNSLEIVE